MRSGNVAIDIDEDMKVVATRIASDSILADLTLKDIAHKYDGFTYRIVAIARDVDTLIPGGDDRVLYDDLVFILTHRNDQPRLEKLLGIRKQRRHRVMILGGGLIAQRVAELLQGSMPVRIIERDEVRAEELSHQLGKTEVFHGDASDSETLLQGGLLDMDTVITATGDNETNIMASVMARHLVKCRKGGAEGEQLKTIALVTKEEYLALASAMGADIVLNPKVLAGNQILKYIRRGKLLSVAHLHGCEAEVVELVADRGAPITRKPLWEFGELMRGRMIIGGYYRGKKWEIAIGGSQIEAGDKVVGICVSRDLPELERLFDR
jgi:trk system potassium uptake protein TrkA